MDTIDTIDLSQPISVICGDSGTTNLPFGVPIMYSFATSYTTRFGTDNAQSQNSLRECVYQFEKMAKVCGRQNLKILTPFIEMKKAHILKLGIELGLVWTMPVHGAAPNCLKKVLNACLLYTSPSPRDATLSRMPSSA